MACFNPHQNCIDVGVGALGSNNGIKQAGHSGPVEGRVLGRASSLLSDRVIILEKLGFLGIFKRNEHHRISIGRDHPPGQPDYGVVVTTDLDTFTKFKSGSDIGDGLVMAPGNLTTRDEIGRPAGCPRSSRSDAGNHGTHITILFANLHGEISDVRCPFRPGHALNPTPDIIVET